MKKEDYLARAKAEVAAAGERIPQYSGGCEECEFSKMGLLERMCTHPAVGCAAFNVDPSDRKYMQECDYQRGRMNIWGPVICGPDGALFEKRKTLWERIFRQ